jgi:hypothetical protein
MPVEIGDGAAFPRGEVFGSNRGAASESDSNQARCERGEESNPWHDELSLFQC